MGAVAMSALNEFEHLLKAGQARAGRQAKRLGDECWIDTGSDQRAYPFIPGELGSHVASITQRAAGMTGA